MALETVRNAVLAIELSVVNDGRKEPGSAYCRAIRLKVLYHCLWSHLAVRLEVACLPLGREERGCHRAVLNSPEHLSSEHQLIEALELLRVMVSLVLFYHVVNGRLILA